MSTASIVIPVYNGSAYLAETVRSALAQTCPVEVIVVDDGSSEDIPAVLAPFRQQVTYLRQENRGLAGARNTGFLAAHGDYILFLDGDDLLDARMIDRCITRLQAEPQASLVYCAWKQLSADGQSFYADVYPAYSGRVLAPLLLRRFFFFASGTLVRRSMLEQVGLFDEALRWGEDADLWLRAALAGCEFAYLPEPLLCYRVHPNSMTARVTPEQVQGWSHVLEKFFASPALPGEIRMLKPEAYSVLYFETAGRFFRLGQVEPACQQLSAAAAANPEVSVDWFLDWLAGTALDPRTADPPGLIANVMDVLPEGLAQFRLLRRRALGRYHTAAAFAYFASGQLDRVRAHLWPALKGNPAVLRNRGFLSIAAQCLTRWR